MYSDAQYMAMAIERANHCESEGGPPRPKVGALLLKDEQILETAFRGEVEAGQHAEYVLLEKKLGSDLVAGSTLYTTLEPCTERHSKAKIPCTDRIIARNIAHVKIGMLDPNQSICGRGIRKLRKAGITTDLFPSGLMAQVEEQNRDFIRHQEAISGSYPTRLPLVNPHYESDFARLDKHWQIGSVLGRETVLIVTGDNFAVELLDRTVAAMLRDEIDQHGRSKSDTPYRRAIILTSARLRADTNLRNAVISVGGPNSNETTKEIIESAEKKGQRPWVSDDGFGIFLPDGMPRVALWGVSAAAVRRAVEHYIDSSDGLKALLSMVWA
jgi:pyrimidine deaminase RibD-like protein